MLLYQPWFLRATKLSLYDLGFDLPRLKKYLDPSDICIHMFMNHTYIVEIWRWCPRTIAMLVIILLGEVYVFCFWEGNNELVGGNYQPHEVVE